MPVIEIKALPQDERVIERAQNRICVEVAKIINVASHGVWSTWQTVPEGLYVEGDQAATAQPNATHPPIVDIKMYQGRPPEMIEAMLNRIAEVLVEELGMAPGNAFITYTELQPGTVYTGGAVRK